MDRKGLDLLLNPRLTCWVGMALILIGSNLWLYWTGWYQANTTCDSNWRMQGGRLRTFAREIAEAEPESGRLAILVDEIDHAFMRQCSISGYMYYGHGRMSGPRHVGIVAFHIGVFLLVYGGIGVAFPMAGKTKGVRFQTIVGLVAVLVAWLAGLCLNAIPSPSRDLPAWEGDIADNLGLLVRVQKSDPSLVPVDVLDRLRLDVASYVFRREEGSIPESRIGEKAKDWLDSHGIPRPRISRNPYMPNRMEMTIPRLSEECLKALREQPAEPAAN